MTMLMLMMMHAAVLCRDFFGISSDFPVSQLMRRGTEKTSLFYVSPTLKRLIDCNQATVSISVIMNSEH